jgi:DNA-directed RNA polymerase subunit E'/Rpb7
MTSIIKLQKKISIESQYLDSNIKENILKKLKNITNNECSKEYGYYININKINKILDNYISSNCENIFLVEFEAEILKPEIDKKYEGKVCMLFGGGIFLNVLNRLKILIPLSTIIDYEYNQIKNNFTNKKNGKVINLNDDLKVVISGTKYSKQNFSCFGKLLEN